AATCSMLSIDLPEKLELTVTAGTVAVDSIEGQPLRRWTIELGSRTQVVVRIAPQGVALEPGEPELRAHAFYDVTRHRIDIAAQWRLEPNGPLSRELRVPLDPGLQLVEV